MTQVMRFYGKYRTPESAVCCLARVAVYPGAKSFKQCMLHRKAGPGGDYCTIHARMIEGGATVPVGYTLTEEGVQR